MNTWKLISTEHATVGELLPFCEPNKIVAANMVYENPDMTCRKLAAYNAEHKKDMRHALYRVLGDCRIMNVIYGKGSARVLVSTNA